MLTILGSLQVGVGGQGVLLREVAYDDADIVVALEE